MLLSAKLTGDKGLKTFIDVLNLKAGISNREILASFFAFNEIRKLNHMTLQSQIITTHFSAVSKSFVDYLVVE